MGRMEVIDALVAQIKKQICSKCPYCKMDGDVCGGEVLPTDIAILNNLSGKGLCKEVQDAGNKVLKFTNKGDES